MSFPVDEKNKTKIIALVSVIVPQAKIYLYGSRARGTNSEWSDIDIALDAGEPIYRLNMAEVRDILEASNIPYKVDVIDLNSVSESLRHAIERDKVLWKQ